MSNKIELLQQMQNTLNDIQEKVMNDKSIDGEKQTEYLESLKELQQSLDKMKNIGIEKSYDKIKADRVYNDENKNSSTNK